jgi:preprotein translocase subunit YajC
MAQPGQESPGGGMANFVFMMLAVFMIFFFLVIRPQKKAQKQREQMIEAVKKGDEVLISAGILGTVVGRKGDVVIVKVDESTKLRVQKSAITSVLKES